jgi:hypothetical protein
MEATSHCVAVAVSFQHARHVGVSQRRWYLKGRSRRKRMAEKNVDFGTLHMKTR